VKSDLQIGIELFNEGKFWEAHEAFEREWMVAQESFKLQIQAIIQVAAVFYHFEQGRSRPALSLARSSLEKFRAARLAHPIASKTPPWVKIDGVEQALEDILYDENSWITHFEQELTLTLNCEQAHELGRLLSSSFSESEELRVDLPLNWAIFWKLRDDESRLLMAHPQENEWVATAALESSHAGALTERLLGAQTGLVFAISEIGSVGGISNVELTVRVI
jgi:hypothetical protein